MRVACSLKPWRCHRPGPKAQAAVQKDMAYGGHHRPFSRPESGFQMTFPMVTLTGSGSLQDRSADRTKAASTSATGAMGQGRRTGGWGMGHGAWDMGHGAGTRTRSRTRTCTGRPAAVAAAASALVRTIFPNTPQNARSDDGRFHPDRRPRCAPIAPRALVQLGPGCLAINQYITRAMASNEPVPVLLHLVFKSA